MPTDPLSQHPVHYRPTVKVALTVAQAAEAINVSSQQILKFVKATDHTHLPARRVGRAFSINLKDLEAWHDRQPMV